jgi:hypothetical protein
MPAMFGCLRLAELRLPLETGRPVGLGADGLREDFNGDLAIEASVEAVDLAHAAGADGREQLIRTEPCLESAASQFAGTSFFNSSNTLEAAAHWEGCSVGCTGIDMSVRPDTENSSRPFPRDPGRT